MNLSVTCVKSDYNMTYRHELRECPEAKRLKKGQCLVAFNSALSIARIIDCEGIIHDAYAPEGEVFDTALLSQMLQRGIGVELHISQAKAKQLDHREAVEEVSQVA